MSNSQSILLIHAGALGDFVLAMSLVDRLRASCSGVKLHALCHCRLACYFAKREILVGWKHLENRMFLPLFSEETATSPDLSAYLNFFDVVVSMLGSDEALCSRNLRRFRGDKLYCIDPKLRPEKDEACQHMIEQWLGDLKAQGLAGAAHESANLRSDHHADDECVVIHPGSGGRNKCWPLENFERLARLLSAAGRRAQFMIGPVEFDLFGADLVARLERTAPVIYEEDVCRAAERLENARAFVGNDAGMTHVASYMGVPTVAIFSSTDPSVWRPLGRDVVVLNDRSGSAIDVEQVLQHVTKMSERKPA